MSRLNKKLTAYIRLFAILAALWGLWDLSVALLQAIGEIDYTYLHLYLRAQLAPGALAILLATALFLSSTHLAKLITYGLPRD